MKKLILITFATLICFLANSQSFSATGDLEITGSLKVTGDFSNDFESHFYRRADFDSLYVNGFPVSHYLIETDSVVYVSELGDDVTGDGTELNPFATIERATINFTNRYIVTNTNVTIQVDTGNYILSQTAKDNLASITLEDVTSELYVLGSYDLIASVTLSATSDPFIYDVLVGGIAPTWPADTFEFEFFQRSTALNNGSTPISWNSSNQLETMPDMTTGSIKTIRTTINLEGDLNRLSVNNRTATTNLKYQNFIFGYCKFISTDHIDLNNQLTFHHCSFRPSATKLVRCNEPIYFQTNTFDCGVLFTKQPYNFNTNYVKSDYADGALRYQESGICRGLILEGSGTNVGIQVRNGSVANNNATGARVGTKIKNTNIAFQMSDGKFSSGPDADQVVIENSNYYLDVLGDPAQLDLPGLILSTPGISYIKDMTYTYSAKKGMRINIPDLNATQDTSYANVIKFEDDSYINSAFELGGSGEVGDVITFDGNKLVPSDSLLSGSYFNWNPPYLFVGTNNYNYLDVNFSNVDNSSFFNYNFISGSDEIYFNQDISALDIYASGVSPYALRLDQTGLQVDESVISNSGKFDSIQGKTSFDELVIGTSDAFIKFDRQEDLEISYHGKHLFDGFTDINNISFNTIKGIGTFYRASNDPTAPTDTSKLMWNGYLQATKLIAKEAELDSIKLNPISKTSHTQGAIWFSSEKNNFQFQNNIENFTHDLGENNVEVYNPTAVAIPNGRIVRRTGSHINGKRVPSVELSGCTTGDSSRIFGTTTTIIQAYSRGIVTISGEVNFLETTGKTKETYLGHAGEFSDTAPPPPYTKIQYGYVTYTDNDSGSISVDPPAKIKRDKLVITGSTSVAGIGTYYSHGFYRAAATSVTLTQASPTVTFGNANSGHGSHAFIVCGGAGTVDAGVEGLRVTGTSIADDGTYITSDADTILGDITTASLNAYFEAKKFNGIVTFELITISGAPTTYSLTINYGYASYDDDQNTDFWVTGINVFGRAGANDSGFDMILYKHSAEGWTYSASGFVPGGTIIAQRSVDNGTKDDLVNGIPFRWKRSNLSEFIEGSGSEGIIIKYITTANNAVAGVTSNVYIEND